MGNFTYENQGAYSFLVYELGPEDQIDSLSLGMITNNKIPGISQAVFTQMDEKKFIKYNVSAKVSVDQFFLGTVNRRRLLGVFASLASAFISADDYMIDSSTLLLDMKYMYADVRSCAAVLICLPILAEAKAPLDLHAFFKNIMFSTQFDQSENCDHIGQILNYLNGSAQFSIVEFKALLDRLLETSGTPTLTPSAPAAQAVPVPTVTVVQAQVAPATNPAAAPQVVAAPQPTSVAPVQAAPIAAPRTPAPAPAPRPQTAQTAAQPVPQLAPGEKEISLFYLLQHYNKDNAAIYERQKAIKKAQKAAGKPVSAPAPAKPGKAPASVPTAAAPFAVPGRPSPVAPAAPVSGGAIPVATPVAGSAIPSVAPIQPIMIPREEMQQAPASFGETTVLGGGSSPIGETTVLGVSPTAEPTPYLIRAKNNERIAITKEIFKIGKEKGYVDYLVSDNGAVSRSHADILRKDGKFFIQDNNSTNHTFVNNRLIPSNTPTQLDDGCTIALGNEMFRFELRRG